MRQLSQPSLSAAGALSAGAAWVESCADGPVSAIKPLGSHDSVSSSEPAPAHVRLRTAFENHYDQIWRLLRRFGVPQSGADDATQQVFLILAERMADVRVGSERAFLFGTAVRLASTLRRVQKREVLTEHADLEASRLPGTDELAHQRRARAMLDSILQQMDEDLRTVFVLYELQQFTSVEIAEMLSIPVGTAASRLRRARQQFTELANQRVSGSEQEGYHG